MTQERLTPEEFARLLSLPEDHPDRIRSATPEFEARVQLLREFEEINDRDPGAHNPRAKSFMDKVRDFFAP
jgi:hypothetical protein